jgi:hypothetical protein
VTIAPLLLFFVWCPTPQPLAGDCLLVVALAAASALAAVTIAPLLLFFVWCPTPQPLAGDCLLVVALAAAAAAVHSRTVLGVYGNSTLEKKSCLKWRPMM